MTSVSRDRDLPAAATGSSVGGGAERCPRCGSQNTKFCYYNNYNFAQPRHFCKACRRYWTLGGSLRDVPIGGTTRSKQQPSRRPGSSSAAPSSPSGRRLSHCQAPATTYTRLSSASSSSPSVNSLDSVAPSIVAISVAPPYPGSTTNNMSGAMDEVGLFTPQLTDPPPGFMALRDPLLHGFDGFPLELGLSETADQFSFGMETGAVGLPFLGEDGSAGLMPGVIGEGFARGVHREGEAWREMAGGADLLGSDGGDCFGWLELATCATPGERSGLQ